MAGKTGTRLPSCRLAVLGSPSCGFSNPFQHFSPCQIRCSLLTKQKHVAFFRIRFVLWLPCVFLLVFPVSFSFFFKRRIFYDLVGCRCLLCLSRFLFDVNLRERFLFLFCCLFCFSFLFFLFFLFFLLAWLMKRLMH